MRDVARESGFSPSTVSITLNDAPLARYLPAETKARIKQAARNLGYRPSSLINQRSHTVGIMVFDVTDPYCTMIRRGIEQMLFESSYVPNLTDAHNDPARFERYLEMLLDRRVEGLIIIANWRFLDIHILGDLANHRIPAVVSLGIHLDRGGKDLAAKEGVTLVRRQCLEVELYRFLDIRKRFFKASALRLTSP